MTAFAPMRFRRLLLNEITTQGRRVVPATLAAMAIGLVAYATNLQGDAINYLYRVLFLLLLLGGGALLTSTIFADMHHPLQRYQYLTLPCSNLERFLVKFLVSGPLYVVFALIAYALFELVAAALSEALLGRHAVFFDATDRLVQYGMMYFFAGHAALFLGAIHFRSFALVKTALVLFLLFWAGFLVTWIAVRIFYWDHFSSLFRIEEPFRLYFPFWSNPPEPWQWALPVLAWLWVLFLAYLRLKDHEA